MDWTGCDLVEQVPGRVSGQPVVKGTRILADLAFGSVTGAMERGILVRTGVEPMSMLMLVGSQFWGVSPRDPRSHLLV
jgi:hypothetical protein